MTRIRWLSVASVVALLLVLAGCGPRSGSKPSSRLAGTAPPPVATSPAVAADAAGEFDGETAIKIRVAGMRFYPEVVRVRAGEPVIWSFEDSGVAHTATAFNGAFDSGLKSSGSFAVRFDAPGTYCYRCLPHPGRNLCNQTAAPARAVFPLLSARPVTRTAPLLLFGGGGRMQGKIIVEP